MEKKDVSLFDVVYYVEHKLLPKLFFEIKEAFVGNALSNEELIYSIMDDVLRNNQLRNPYTKEDFKTEPIRIHEHIFVLKLNFPKPEREPLCYCSYIVFSPDMQNSEYFCIEKGNEYSDGMPFVCGWSPEGNHLNYGNITIEDDADMLKCVELFCQSMINKIKADDE